MITDIKALIAEGKGFKADVVIIGGGTVGLFLAVQLRKKGQSVVVIESGSKVASTNENALKSVVVGRPHEGTIIGRASGLGGTSTLWGGQLAEFDEFDFDRLDVDWGGITYAEMRELYNSTYDALGIGRLPNIDLCRSKFGAENKHDTKIERFFTSWMSQPNFASLYKSSIVSDSDLNIILETSVNQLEFKGGKAKVAVAKHIGGSKILIEGEHFVFAAGTIENSRLFLAMARDENCPWSSNQQIGRNFQDHLGHCVATVKPLNETKFRNYFENGWIGGVKLQPKLRFTSHARASVQSGVSGFFLYDSELSTNIANIKGLVRTLVAGVGYSKAQSIVRDFFAMGSTMYPLVKRYIFEKRVMAVFERGIGFYIQAEQIPQVDSRIDLVSQHTLNDELPKARVNWVATGDEGGAVLQFALAADNYLRERGLASMTIDRELKLDPFSYMSRFRDTYHQSGGMCIASTPDRGAVDQDCRVWGAANVYVAGAAVFPVASHANTTLTALALSYKLARKIARAYE